MEPQQVAPCTRWDGRGWGQLVQLWGGLLTCESPLLSHLTKCRLALVSVPSGYAQLMPSVMASFPEGAGLPGGLPWEGCAHMGAGSSGIWCWELSTPCPTSSHPTP